MPSQTDTTYKKLDQLRRPNYVLPAYVNSRQLVLFGVTAMYLGGLGYSDSMVQPGSDHYWVVIVLLTVLYALVMKYLFAKSERKPMFACDYSGAYLYSGSQDKYALIPWDRVSNITLDASTIHQSPIIIIEVTLDNAKLSRELEGTYPLDGTTATGQPSPWEGQGTDRLRLAVPFKCFSPRREINRIYKMREGAGRGPYV